MHQNHHQDKELTLPQTWRENLETTLRCIYSRRRPRTPTWGSQQKAQHLPQPGSGSSWETVQAWPPRRNSGFQIKALGETEDRSEERSQQSWGITGALLCWKHQRRHEIVFVWKINQSCGHLYASVALNKVCLWISDAIQSFTSVVLPSTATDAKMIYYLISILISGDTLAVIHHTRRYQRSCLGAKHSGRSHRFSLSACVTF